MSRTHLLKSVGLMMFAALIGKAILIIREPIIAAYFGTSAQTDAYNVAMTIVTMLLGVTVLPIETILVPVYVERLHKSRQEGERFIGQTLTVYLLILSSVLLMARLAAPGLVHLYAPGFAPETAALAVHLTRILGLFAVASGLAGYFIVILTAHQEFFWVALGPIVAATLVIVVLLVAAPGLGIDALAWGMVAGNVAQMICLGLSIRRRTVRLALGFHLGETIHALGKLSGWMLAGRFIGQGNDLIDRNMLSYLSEGSIAALGFARSIYLLPFEIFTTGITRVIIADFSWDLARGDVRALVQDLSLVIRMAAFFLIPTTAGLVVLRVPIVQVLYQRGAFNEAATRATAVTLLFLSLGLYFRALNFIGGRVFIARQRLLVPTVIGVVALATHVGLNVALVPRWQSAGVALSLTLTELIGAMLYLGKVRWELGPLGGRRILASLVKMGIAAGAMMASLMPLNGILCMPTWSSLTRFGLLLLTVLLGVAIYGGILYLLRMEELRIALRMGRDFVQRQISWPIPGDQVR